MGESIVIAVKLKLDFWIKISSVEAIVSILNQQDPSFRISRIHTDAITKTAPCCQL